MGVVGQVAAVGPGESGGVPGWLSPVPGEPRSLGALFFDIFSNFMQFSISAKVRKSVWGGGGPVEYF